jgi:prevent-host-death family protein
MKSVNIHQAKTHLSRLIEEAASGEEIIIAKAGQPRARLVACERKRRVLGRLRGQIRIGADFDAPLPDELLRAFGAKR